MDIYSLFWDRKTTTITNSNSNNNKTTYKALLSADI